MLCILRDCFEKDNQSEPPIPNNSMRKLGLLLLLLSFSVFAQEVKEKPRKKVTGEKVKLDSPFSTIYMHLYYLDENSYDVTRSSYAVYGEKRKHAEEIAVKIKQVIVGKGLKFEFDAIPRDPNYLDTISGIEDEHKYILFPEDVPEIYLVKNKRDGRWYYSEETNTEIIRLYREMYPEGADYLKSLIPEVGHEKYFDLKLWQYLGILLYLLIAIGLFYVFKGLCFWFFKRIEGLTMRYSDYSVNESLKKLSRPLALIMVFLLIEEYLPLLEFTIRVNLFVFSGIRIAETILWVFVTLNLIQVIIAISKTYTKKSYSKLDQQLTPVIRKLLRGFVIFLGILKMLTILGADIKTVLAGASIGGIAVALAAQDTVKNLIGTFMIFFDKPFQIGDWIDGGGLVGTVEEVGFRSSRIRSADTSIYTIPNSKLSEIVIENKGLLINRRYKAHLGLRYDTPPELIDAFVKGVRRLIEEHPDTRSDAYNVEFVGFGEFSLRILLVVYFTDPGWSAEQASRHTLNLGIIQFAKDLGVQFAFPTQTVAMETFPEKTSRKPIYDTDSTRAERITNDSVIAFKEGFNPKQEG